MPRFVLEWARQGPENGEFNFSIFIAINHGEEIFVTDFTNSRAQEVSTERKFFFAFEISLFPCEMALDQEGNLFSFTPAFRRLVMKRAWHILLTFGGGGRRDDAAIR